MAACQGNVTACGLGMFIAYCCTWEGEERTINVQTDQVKGECDVIDAEERENSLCISGGQRICGSENLQENQCDTLRHPKTSTVTSSWNP